MKSLRIEAPKKKPGRRKRIEYAGEYFDSSLEKMRWMKLLDAVAKGTISNLRRHVEYELIPSQKVDADGLGYRKKVIETRVTYVAQFVYDKDGQEVIEDTRAKWAPHDTIKRKMMLYYKGLRTRRIKSPWEPV